MRAGIAVALISGSLLPSWQKAGLRVCANFEEVEGVSEATQGTEMPTCLLAGMQARG